MVNGNLIMNELILRLMLSDWKKALRKIFGLGNMAYEEIMRMRIPLYKSPVYIGKTGHDLIKQILQNRTPLMITRFGSNELSAIAHYVRNRTKENKKPYPKSIIHHLNNNAGFFPPNEKYIDKFCMEFIDCIRNADIVGVWFNDFEDYACNEYCPSANLVELGCLEPYHFQYPWSSILKDKKVLVIHPFSETINHQYNANRSLLFSNPEVLPDFRLETLRSVQSIAGLHVPFKTWFDALEYMRGQIAMKDFDIAIIGAGAYGLPLAKFVKEIGKQAIHLGGATQILFGIKGHRWETEYKNTTGKIFNEYWVRPSESEKPKGAEKVENSCYW